MGYSNCRPRPNTKHCPPEAQSFLKHCAPLSPRVPVANLPMALSKKGPIAFRLRAEDSSVSPRAPTMISQLRLLLSTVKPEISRNCLSICASRTRVC